MVMQHRQFLWLQLLGMIEAVLDFDMFIGKQYMQKRRFRTPNNINM